MDTDNFEEKLIQMTKPEVNRLRHQDLLARAISNARDKSMVSWWWLIIPLFIMAMLMMKSIYVPGSTFILNMHELMTSQKLLSAAFFLIMPVLLIIFNLISIREVYFLSGSPKKIDFLQIVRVNLLVIILSILILLVYAL